MSTKLTNYMREQIVKDLLAHRFTKAADKLVKDRAAFALKVYRDYYPRAILSKIEALPDGWLGTENEIRAQFSGRVDHIPFNGALYGIIASVRTPTDVAFKPMLSKDKGRILGVYDPAHPLAVAHAALDERRKDLGSQMDSAKKQAEAAVGNASTIARLVDMWPEIEPFARKHAATTKLPLPALPTRELNALLDLPVAA